MTKETLDLTNKSTESLYSTRLLVIQTIYSFEILNDKKKLEQILTDCIDYYNSKFPNKNLDQNYYKELVTFIVDSIHTIDKKIESNIDNNWKIERLPKLVLSILRSGIGDLNFYSKSNKALLINDYLEASKSLNHSEEIGFINSILDKASN